MKNFVRKYWKYVLFLVLLSPSFWNLLKPGYFNMHDDLQVMRIFEMDKCFADGQIPCRWVPDMGYGYGQPMFNFYSAFPYYLGIVIRMVAPISIMWTVKLLFAISLVGGAVGMYLLVKELWGEWSGVLSAVLYTYAPYHSLDVYVRGALSESFALMLLPFLWLSFYKLIRRGSFKNVFCAAITFGLLLSTHNVSSLMYAPITVIWVVFWIIKTKNYSAIKNIVLSGALGIGVASFFILPILLESKYVQIGWLTTDYLNFRAHFTTIYQLFISRHWGYGPSVFGPVDDLSFAIGWPNWWLGIPLVAVVYFWFKDKTKRSWAVLTLGLLFFAGFFAFMTHERSIPVWLAIPTLAIVQFPWRFLGLTIFLLSVASGALATGKYMKYIVGFIVLLSIGLNFNFFKPQYFFLKDTDQTKLSGEQFVIQQKSAILDYLPITAPVAPKEAAFSDPLVASGSGVVKNYSKRSNSFFFDVEAYGPVKVQVPVMYFPGWKIIDGNKEIPAYPQGKYGLITFEVPEGKYIIQGRLTDTPVRKAGNALTVISLTLLLAGLMLEINNKKFAWFKKR